MQRGMESFWVEGKIKLLMCGQLKVEFQAFYQLSTFLFLQCKYLLCAFNTSAARYIMFARPLAAGIDDTHIPGAKGWVDMT